MPTYEYPRPALTADVVVLRDLGGRAQVLLIQRRFDPFAGSWALPGGFVDEYEPPVDAARRELAEETGLSWPGELELVGVFGKRGRDPRGWTVTAAYAVDIGMALTHVQAGDDAGDARWFDITGLPQLAFDHDEIIEAAVSHRHKDGGASF